MEKDKVKLYKDHEKINHRNIKEYLENIKDLAENIHNTKELDSDCFLLENALIEKEKPHIPDHSKCDFMTSEKDSNKATEKRICRCMKYYNQEKCNECEFEQKMYLQNSDRYEVVDYEVPMDYVMKNIGGIDLEIKDRKTGIIYATEVKPENSNETLVRMIAEILTYTIGKVTDTYKPAICFFYNSKQKEDFCKKEIQENEDFKFLMTLVDVFYITYEIEDNVAKYIIHDNKEEPLWK